MDMPAKMASRLATGLKKFKPILEAAQKHDVNESDTVVIVQDILHEVFGFDKYSDITSEHAIHGTFCDLAIKLTGKIDILAGSSLLQESNGVSTRSNSPSRSARCSS
jgi:hypothetical protein